MEPTTAPALSERRAQLGQCAFTWGDYWSDHRCDNAADSGMDDGFCLPHSPSELKDVAFFRDFIAKAKAADNENLTCIGWHFPEEVDLTLAALGSVDFDYARFPKGLQLGSAQLKGRARFERAIFGSAVLSSATFCRETYFYRARFQGAAAFFGTRFESQIRFDESVFESSVGFGTAEFKKHPSFDNARFRTIADFDRTLLPAGTTFSGVHFGIASFRDTDLSGVAFRACDLSGTRLGESRNLSQAVIDEPTWARYRARPPIPAWCIALGRRWAARTGATAWEPSIVRDTVVEENAARRARSPSGYRIAERAYRELRRAAEVRRDHRETARLRTRELEMRRLRLGAEDPVIGQLRANLFSIEALYMHLSAYGESLLRPVLAMGVFAGLVFPYLLALTGADVFGRTYTLVPIFDDRAWQGYGDLVVLSLHLMAATNPSSQTGVGAELVQLLVRITGPLLAILIVIAVRRRVQASR